MRDEQKKKRCCSASPHDTKVMRKIRGWMNEHHPTDCDVDEAEQVIRLLETLIKLQQAASTTLTVLEDKKLHGLIENSEAGMAYEDFLRIEADRLRPFLRETKYKQIVDDSTPIIIHKDWPVDENENKELRKLIWLRHGCRITSLYGDDGEMQCGTCGIDFKRSPVADIIKRFEAIAIKALEKARDKEQLCESCGDTKKVCKACGKNHFGKTYRHPYFLVPCKDCPPICDDCGKPMKFTGQVPEYGEEVGKPGSRIPVGMNRMYECGCKDQEPVTNTQ